MRTNLFLSNRNRPVWMPKTTKAVAKEVKNATRLSPAELWADPGWSDEGDIVALEQAAVRRGSGGKSCRRSAGKRVSTDSQKDAQYDDICIGREGL